MRQNKRTVIRLAIVACALFAIAFFIYIMLSNPLEKEMYWIFGHDKTYVHCPSCGLTRCVYCLATLKFKEAFYYHAYFVVTLPIIAYSALCLGVNLFFGRKIIPYPKSYKVVLIVWLVGWMLFSIARNFTATIY